MDTKEISTDNGVGLDDSLSTENDVLRAVDERPAGDFVSSVLHSGLLAMGTDVVFLVLEYSQSRYIHPWLVWAAWWRTRTSRSPAAIGVFSG